MRTSSVRGFGVVVILCALSMAFGMPALAAKGSDQTLKGEVLIVTDDFYLIKERNGKGVQVHLDKGTKRSGTIKVGDNVEAQVSGDGRALSIRVAK
jgi:hypothetical protein